MLSERPSSFSETRNTWPGKRAQNATTSSGVVALASESIGRAWRTVGPRSSAGARPGVHGGALVPAAGFGGAAARGDIGRAIVRLGGMLMGQGGALEPNHSPRARDFRRLPGALGAHRRLARRAWLAAARCA